MLQMKVIRALAISLATLTVILLISTFNSSAQSVGINATGAAPNASALLDLSSTNKGFLITRADTGSIVSPAFGLMTLAPIDSCLYMYSGTKWKSIGGVGTDCSCTSSIPSTSLFPCGGTAIPIVEVLNPATGKTWMDRNLGASQVATSSTNAASFGDIYQWGRCSDGHEKRTSSTTTTLSLTNTPANNNFIIAPTTPFDWRSPQNNNLWQGVNGINNPCPTGYRIPTESELNSERLTWTSNNALGGFGSPLKLTMGGFRFYNTGVIDYMNINGYYWSSTVAGTEAKALAFLDTFAYMSTDDRAYGFSIRCIKD
jgi:uncharacterized protein (TIGR02145 family)